MLLLWHPALGFPFRPHLKGILWNCIWGRLWHSNDLLWYQGSQYILNKILLVSRDPAFAKKIFPIPFHQQQPNCYKVEWIHSFISFTQNFSSMIWISLQKLSLIKQCFWILMPLIRFFSFSDNSTLTLEMVVHENLSRSAVFKIINTNDYFAFKVT